MNVPGSRRNVQNLVEEHYAALYRYAYRLAGCAADAEDLTQEAFCQAQLKLGQLRDHDRAKAWLFSVLPTPICTGWAVKISPRYRWIWSATCPNACPRRCRKWTPNCCKRC